MKILVYGAGVLGCNLARNLLRAGKDVTLLARGNWAAEIKQNGLRIKDKFSLRTSVSRIPVVTELAPDAMYDVIFVVLRYTQLDSALDTLRANRTKNIVFVGNNVQARVLAGAWTKAYEADKVSIFGGIVALNRPVTRETAELMKPIFLEIIMAPSFTPEALEVLSTKKNLRLLEVPMEKSDAKQRQLVSVTGGLLVQDLDLETRPVTADMCVTEKRPTERQLADLDFGWRIVKHVKSNAIVVVKDGRTLGVGAGQMNRIGSAELALKQAHAQGVTEGLVLASDGFFPFDDCVSLAAASGVEAIVQPGGSVRDEDSIRKANESGIPMLFTGMRHFKH